MSGHLEKFTPPPWVLDPEGEWVYSTSDSIEKHDLVCDPPLLNGLYPTWKANSTLIITAPDLYQQNKFALKKLRDVKAFLEANPETQDMTAYWDDTEGDGGALLDEVNAQIGDLERVQAKARGEIRY